MAWGNPLLSYWRRGCEKPTAAEAALEPAIAALGERYRHQYPFWDLKYFADFALLDRKLIIEVDGDSHERPEQKEKDLRHTLDVLKLGWFVVRISNEDALENPKGSLEMVMKVAEMNPAIQNKDYLIQQYSAALDQLHQDYPHLLAAPAKRSRRRRRPAKGVAANRRQARDKQPSPAPARSSRRQAAAAESTQRE